MARKPQVTKTIRLPVLKKRHDDEFVLQTLDLCDGRLHTVRTLRKRLDKLMAEVDADTLAKQVLCTRACFLLGYLESQEVDSMAGEDLNWRNYLAALRSLTDILAKLGLDRAKENAKRLEDYLIDIKSKKKKA